MTFKSGSLGLVTILVLLALVPSTFAQVTLSVSEDIVSSNEVATTRNAQTTQPGSLGAGISVTGTVSSSNTGTTVLRLSFPGVITSSSGYVNSSIQSANGQSPLCTTSVVNIGNVFFGSPSGAQTNQIGLVACPVTTVPANDPIKITGATGLFANVSNPVVNTANKRVDIVLPASTQYNSTNSPGNTTSAVANGFFKLVGVRIDANGLTGAQSVTPALDNVANGYQLGSSAFTIINNLADGIGNFAIGSAPGRTSNGTVTLFTNNSVPKSLGSFIFTEGFASAWRTLTDVSEGSLCGSSCNATQIKLTFSGIPTGVTLTLQTPTAGTTLANINAAASLSNTSITATNNTSTMTITGESLTSTETLEIDYTVNQPASTVVLTANSPITATATLFPLGDGVYTSPTAVTMPQGTARGDQGYPSFVEKDYGPVTLVNVVPASTTMLIPFAMATGPYDTAITIANTTADRFGTQGATPSPGTLKFDFFPAAATGAGTSFTLTTSATAHPGTGLDSAGSLAAGGTFTDTLSDLLRVAGAPATFQGYIFVTTSFLDAHGTSYISGDGFKTNTLNSILVLAPPATQSRNSPTNSVESLGF